jgi:hypothetical protein
MLEVVWIQMPNCSFRNLDAWAPFHGSVSPFLVVADLIGADVGASLGATGITDAFCPLAKGLNGGPPKDSGEAAAFLPSLGV